MSYTHSDEPADEEAEPGKGTSLGDMVVRIKLNDAELIRHAIEATAREHGKPLADVLEALRALTGRIPPFDWRDAGARSFLSEMARLHLGDAYRADTLDQSRLHLLDGAAVMLFMVEALDRLKDPMF